MRLKGSVQSANIANFIRSAKYMMKTLHERPRTHGRGMFFYKKIRLDFEY